MWRAPTADPTSLPSGAGISKPRVRRGWRSRKSPINSYC